MAGRGRPREFDRTAALETAMFTFWRKGYGSASTADLCEAMGIHMPSLYAAFGSKEALFCEAFEHYNSQLGLGIWGEIGAHESARADFEAFLMAGTRLLQCVDPSPGGCMVMLSAISEGFPEGVNHVVQQARRANLALLNDRLSSAVREKELPKNTDVDQWARFYLGVFQGMAIQARDGATTGELTGIVEAAMSAWPCE
jgi:AcrR family transcriptional regulator